MNHAASDIGRQMQVIRRELADDMENIAESTREMADWQVYFKRYPWVMLGAAAVAAYSVVPKRVNLVQPDAEALLELAKRKKLVVEAKPKNQARGGVSGALLSLAGTIALRTAMTYAGNYFSQMSAPVAPSATGMDSVGSELSSGSPS